MNVAWEKDACPFCCETKLAVILHNAMHEPQDWIDIEDSDLGGPSWKILEGLMKMGREDISIKGYLPTALTKGVVHNFVRSVHHYYWFLKELFKRR